MIAHHSYCFNAKKSSQDYPFRLRGCIGQMGSVFLQLFSHFSYVISWPSFSFVFPLYASIRAIETDEESSYQQCLRYWVLFSIASIFEYTFAKLLIWFSLWPYLKGITLAVLVVPSFACATYVYSHFIRPHVAKDSSFYAIHVAERGNQIDLNGLLARPGILNRDACGELENPFILEEYDDVFSTTKNVPPQSLHIKQVQSQRSCPLCLITATNEKCLKKHFQGKKHENTVQEHKQNRVAEMEEADNVLAVKRTNDIFLRFNKLTWANYKKLTGLICPVVRPEIWLTWIKPESGWIKLNTDGSVDKVTSTFSGVLRDSHGNPLCGYIGKAPGDDIFFAELWGIWRGVVLALGLGIKALWVESDSLSVVKTINRDQGYGPKASGCLKHIWMLLKKFEKLRVSHSWREANRAADFLSKMDVSGSDLVIWPTDFPTPLRKIIREDAEGRKYHRR